MSDPARGDVDAVARRLGRLRSRIRGAGGDDTVQIVAVTKGFGRWAVDVALELGLRRVGENYAQELLAKVDPARDVVGRGPEWHFIGRLQRNKVRTIAPYVALWQSVDRLRVGREIATRAPGAAVLVQLNLSGEEHKGGCDWEEAPELVGALGEEGLQVRGLMGVGPAGPAEAARTPFRRLVQLADELDLPIRSIGMSEDLEVAVEEGATMVRVGRELFGPRPTAG